MRTSHATFVVVVAACCVAAYAGCSKQPEPRMTPASGWEPVATTEPNTHNTADVYGTPAPPSSATDTTRPEDRMRTRDQAVEALTAARCIHQNHCGRIGPKHEFSSWDACRDQEREAARANLVGCPSRVSTPALDTCLNDVRMQDCDTTPDTLSAVAACAFEQLCKADALPSDAPTPFQ